MTSASGNSTPELEMLYHRLLRLGVSYGDFKRIKASPLNFGDWAKELSQLAKHYEEAADNTILLHRLAVGMKPPGMRMRRKILWLTCR